MSSEEPKLVCFLCNWCSYAGADHAGGNRKTYSSGALIIRVPCSGRVEPGMIYEAFVKGADGVLVCGCHPGDCHYVEGNYKAARRMALLKTMTEQFGIEPGRLRLEWISATEGERFVELVNEMVEGLKGLGPLELTTAPLFTTAQGEAL